VLASIKRAGLVVLLVATGYSVSLGQPLHPGMRIRITSDSLTPTTQTVKLLDFDRKTLIVELNDPFDTLRLARASVHRVATLRVKTYGKQGFALGAIAGTGVGIIAGLANTRDKHTGRSLYMIPYVLPSYLIGATLGGLAGSRKYRYDWVPIPTWGY